jgi:two-component system phosphate regulon response regulator PhoB
MPRRTTAPAVRRIVRVSKPLVLVVATEAPLATLLRYNLEKQGLRIEEAVSGEEAMTRIKKVKPDLVLLEWKLPVMSGPELCRQIRRHRATRDVPVIVMTTRAEDQDAARRLDARVDGYFRKPFSLDRLLARMRTLLRRAGTLPTEARFTFHDLTMDLVAHRAERNGRPLPLSPLEFRLLQFFLEHPHQVFAREELLDAVWGPDVNFDPRTVDAYIRRLRKSLNAPGERDLVRTVRSAGYALDADQNYAHRKFG